MKEFDLQKAKEGHPVCTRDGKPVRILCFDKHDDSGSPIVALVCGNDKNEALFDYHINGRFINRRELCNDLMMVTEKKQGWINIYKDNILGTFVYDTEDEALLHKDNDCIATTQIEWEE